MAKKKCSKCKEKKPQSLFGVDRKQKDGLSLYCKQCYRDINRQYREANRDKIRQLNRAWHENNRDRIRRKHREWKKNNSFKHKLSKIRCDAKKRGYEPCVASVEELNDLYTGHCYICGVHESRVSKSLALDHCHKTGAPRGFLCDKCNSALGLLGDSTDLVYKALAYLFKNEKQCQENQETSCCSFHIAG